MTVLDASHSATGFTPGKRSPASERSDSLAAFAGWSLNAFNLFVLVFFLGTISRWIPLLRLWICKKPAHVANASLPIRAARCG